jgi:hypothetical protein
MELKLELKRNLEWENVNDFHRSNESQLLFYEVLVENILT